MGYAGYSPGNVVAEKLTPLQQALQGLPLEQAAEALEIIHKLTKNIVANPKDDKFRKIKLTNAKIAEKITDIPGAVDLMKEMGWVAKEIEGEGSVLELPSSLRFRHESEVVAIIDAKDYYKKQEEIEKRRRVRASKEKTAEEEAMQKKIEADRKEKEAEGPVTQGSVAKKIVGGAHVISAADLGIGKSSGGG